MLMAQANRARLARLAAKPRIDRLWLEVQTAAILNSIKNPRNKIPLKGK